MGISVLFDMRQWRMRDISQYRNWIHCESSGHACKGIRNAHGFLGLKPHQDLWVLGCRRRQVWHMLESTLIKQRGEYIAQCQTKNKKQARHGRLQCLRERTG